MRSAVNRWRPYTNFLDAIGAGSTIFCTQYRKKDWHARLGADVRADAITDRIVHNTVWVDMGDFNMRKKLGGRTAS